MKAPMYNSDKKKSPLTLLWKVILPVALLIIWKIATTYGNIHPIILPRLESMVHDFVTMIKSGELCKHTLVSFQRCFVGFFVGSVVGIMSGIILGSFRFLEDLFDIMINFIRSIPKTALAPLLIVWFGFGDLPKVLLICLASFFYTVIPTIEGVKNVDYQLIKSAKSMGANDWQVLCNVIFPAALPSIYAGIRLAVSSSLIVLVFVEIISGNSGLGYLLENSRESLNMSTMFMTLIILGVIGFLIDWLVRYSEEKLMPWRKGKTIS